jgi:glycerophosphocholine phosphodiesterase GPCPD1
LIAFGHALPSTLQDTFGRTSVPLLTSKGIPIGKIYIGYLFVRPLGQDVGPLKMTASYAKHWKKRIALEVGHRGMGNSYTKLAVARENTLVGTQF